MGYRSKQRILNRKISNDRETFKKMFTILDHQGNANQKTLRFPFILSEWLRSKSQVTAHAGKDMEQGNTPSLLGEVQTFTASLEVRMIVSQKTRSYSTSKHSYTTFGHLFKECSITPQGHLFNYAHSSIMCNSKNLETTEMSLN